MGFSIGLGGNKSSSSNRTTFTPNTATSALFYPAYNAASNALGNAAATPYTGQMTAGLTADQTSAAQLARDNVGAGKDTLGGAISTAQGVAGYQPQQVTASPIGTATAQAAQIDRSAVRDVSNGQIDTGRIGALMNPYLASVADRTLSGLERSREQAIAQNQSAATLANAYGGSRHGVVDSLTNEAFAKQAADSLANLYSAGYSQAADLANSEAGRGQAASQANAANDLAVAGQNAGFGQQANLYNAGATNATNQFNAGQSLQAQGMNQTAGLNAAGLNLNAANSLAAFGQQQQQMGANDALLQNQFGAQEQATNQAGLNAQYQDFLRLYNDPYRQADAYGNLIGSIGNLYAGATQKGKSSGSSFGFTASGSYGGR